jgi:hypothetical protein
LFDVTVRRVATGDEVARLIDAPANTVLKLMNDTLHIMLAEDADIDMSIRVHGERERL